MDWNAMAAATAATLTALAWKVAGAVVLWIIGRWLIGFALRMMGAALARQQFDATLTRYMQTGLSVVLNIALVVALLGFFGVETTTFAALSPPAASRSAWPGAACWRTSLPVRSSSFLRPFKVGDVVNAGGVTGTVEAIGLFGTTIDTPDNVRPSSATTRSSPTPSRTSPPTRIAAWI